MTGGVSSPGSGTSVATPSGTDVALLRLLARREARQRVGRNVLGDYRARRDPRAVADLDGGHERTMNPRLDVTAYAGALLRPILVADVGSDVARGDVRPRSDIGVADVRQVRHFRAFTDRRVLDLDERARFGACLEHRSGANVTERTDRRSLADDRVDDDGVGPDRGSARDRRAAPEDGERLDAGVDPRRRRIDDRDAGFHVLRVDAVA